MILKNNTIKAFLIISFFIYLLIPDSAYSQNNDYSSNTVIVKLNKQNKYFFDNNKVHEINTIEISKISKISKNKKNELGIYKLTISNQFPVLESCKILEKSNLFEYCQANYYDKILFSPSDPRAASQYALSITKAFEAWDIDKGDSTIIIGVTDTGIDFDHEDLRTNIYYNTNDPIDGVDNDFDGYIDNYMGWDFGSNDNNPQWNESGTSGNQIHGVFTAGLAGARTNNDLGMASIGFSNKILPIKISNDYGGISTGYEAIIYAAEHGCKIINCSWGSTSPHEYGKDVIKYVTENLGVIIVAAAGNDNNEALFYPASYDNVVSVAASNSIDEKWPNSSYNWRVDVSAPGQNVLSTLSNSTYGTSSGTSFSSPIVASSLALLMSYYPDTMSNKQLIEILKSTSDLIDTVGGNSYYTNKLGKGRINLLKALQGNFGASLSFLNFNIEKDGVNAKAGDTAIFTGEIINYLKPIENVSVRIKCNSEYINIIDSTFTISSLDENEEFIVNTANLKLVLAEDIPNHTNLDFIVEYNSTNYTNTETKIITIKLPNIEVDKNRIHTSIFPNGTIAYNIDRDGFGFSLDNNDNILYEMGFISGSNSTNASTNIRSYSDFNSITKLDSLSINNIWTAYNTIRNTTFDNSNVNVDYMVFNDSIYNNIIFIDYKIINNSDENWSDYYFGIFADWDIYPYNSNYTSIDSNLSLAITESFIDQQKAGIQLLTHSNWNRFAFDNVQNNNNIQSTNGFTREELYLALSTNNHFTGIETDGTDVLDLMSAGPFELEIGDTLELSFAILADTCLENIINSGKLAQQLYDSLNIGELQILEIESRNDFIIYPNPSSSIIKIDLKDIVNINLYDLKGQIQHIRYIGRNKKQIDISKLEAGMYIIKINTKSKSYSRKIIVN